jgi:PIN domain nuclease of toxin-antitoxin system
MTLVLDTSAVIALLRSEPGAQRVAERVGEGAISCVSLAEVISHGVRGGVPAEQVRADFAASQIPVHAFGEDDAVVAGALYTATKHLGLSLGDRACLALAKRLGCGVLTGDRAWAKLDIGIAVEVFR